MKPNFILGLDLEGMNEDVINKGINIEKDRITEVGAVLWDCAQNSPVKIFSELVDEKDRIPINEDNTEVTGLTEEIVSTWGEEPGEVYLNLAKLMEKADYIMAHNGGGALVKGDVNGDYLQNFGYDYPMLKKAFQRHGIVWPDIPWIDSMRDIEFPKKIRGRSMALLEHAHGFINPFPHRAVTDVLAMLKIASQYDYERMVALALSTRVNIIAQFDAPNWKNKAEVEEFNKVKAKVSKAGFRWKPEKKIWIKQGVHKILLEEGAFNNLEFNWRAIDQETGAVVLMHVPGGPEADPGDIPF